VREDTLLEATARSLGLIIGTALAMLAADYAVSYGVVIALFGGGLVMFAVIPVVAVALAAVIIGLSKALTGRMNIFGAIVVTLLLAYVGGYGLLNHVLSPAAVQNDLPLHLAICGLSALALGLFLRPWPLRILGVAAGVGVLVLITLLPVIQHIEQEQEYAQSQADVSEEKLEYFEAYGVIPLVTDLDGWSNPLVRATGGDAITWMRSDTGAVADVLVSGNVDEATIDAHFGCTWIHRDGDSNTPAPDGSYEWCVHTGNQWARPDGTGVAFIRDGTLVTLNAGDDFDIRDTAGARSATAEEVAALFGSLRQMTAAEVDEHIVPVYDGVDTPVIQTPGL
jgi:hypothetical protein